MENKKYPSSVVIKFLACSLIGIFLFFVPISLNGKSTIPLDHIVNFVLKIPYFREVYGTLVIIIGVFLPFYKKTWNKNTTSQSVSSSNPLISNAYTVPYGCQTYCFFCCKLHCYWCVLSYPVTKLSSFFDFTRIQMNIIHIT